MIDFQGTGGPNIYGTGLSSNDEQYLLSVLGPVGITSVDQLRGMSQEQINALVAQVTSQNTGMAPDPGVFGGPGSGPGLPPGYGPGQGTPPGGGGAPAGASHVGDQGPEWTQKSDGSWVNAAGQPWDPTKGKPQEIANAEAGLANPWDLPKQPYKTADQQRQEAQWLHDNPPPKPPFAATGKQTWTQVSGGWALQDPTLNVTNMYKTDGTPVRVTTKDAQGNLSTTFENGSKEIVQPNGWKTSYDSTGKELGHKWTAPAPPSHQQQMQDANAAARGLIGGGPGGLPGMNMGSLSAPGGMQDFLKKNDPAWAAQWAKPASGQRQPGQDLLPGDPGYGNPSHAAGSYYDNATNQWKSADGQPYVAPNPQGGSYNAIGSTGGGSVPYQTLYDAGGNPYKAPLDMTAGVGGNAGVNYNFDPQGPAHVPDNGGISPYPKMAPTAPPYVPPGGNPPPGMPGGVPGPTPPPGAGMPGGVPGPTGPPAQYGGPGGGSSGQPPPAPQPPDQGRPPMTAPGYPDPTNPLGPKIGGPTGPPMREPGPSAPPPMPPTPTPPNPGFTQAGPTAMPGVYGSSYQQGGYAAVAGMPVSQGYSSQQAGNFVPLQQQPPWTTGVPQQQTPRTFQPMGQPAPVTLPGSIQPQIQPIQPPVGIEPKPVQPPPTAMPPTTLPSPTSPQPTPIKPPTTSGDPTKEAFTQYSSLKSTALVRPPSPTVRL